MGFVSKGLSVRCEILFLLIIYLNSLILSFFTLIYGWLFFSLFFVVNWDLLALVFM